MSRHSTSIPSQQVSKVLTIGVPFEMRCVIAMTPALCIIKQRCKSLNEWRMQLR